MTGVRFREDTGFEGKCDACLEWWPLDSEFWDTRRGFRHCRVCSRTMTKLRLRELRTRDEIRERHNAYMRAYYQDAKGIVNAKRRERRRLLRLTDPAYVERQRAYQREYMRRKRAAGRAA